MMETWRRWAGALLFISRYWEPGASHEAVPVAAVHGSVTSGGLANLVTSSPSPVSGYILFIATLEQGYGEPPPCRHTASCHRLWRGYCLCALEPCQFQPGVSLVSGICDSTPLTQLVTVFQSDCCVCCVQCARRGHSTVSLECVFHVMLCRMGSETVSEERMKCTLLNWNLIKLSPHTVVHTKCLKEEAHMLFRGRIKSPTHTFINKENLKLGAHMLFRGRIKSPTHTFINKENLKLGCVCSPTHTLINKENLKLGRLSCGALSRVDILEVRNFTESQLECGIPNMDYVDKTEEHTRRTRRKRVVGGLEALPTQIQWQVAVEEDGRIHCGGVYLGGCWVLTAAHCVREKPQAFRIKFSLWKKLSLLTTTDIIPVKNIIIHKEYDPRTYKNDIALVQLKELAFQKECLHPNPAVRAVCVPWSPLQFQHGDTCTISGWGRNKEGGTTNALKWANVTIIGDCKKYYKERYFDGMECAGDLDGKVDSCQGDSGGPLVCKDASGLSYVWGIVSWGEKCGEADYPGVYTKVAHYFEWIRFHTGWTAVTKYNH
ncbi:hypothetical protein NFI96_009228 [Prochilodus magdalenae]|nr:hypothetical protein NFI96_009228 [Prochilodus magdalenae]